MSNGNIDVGNQAATRKGGHRVVEQLAKPDGSSQRRIDKTIAPKAERSGNCGAMSQQGGDFGRGHQSAPQKFVQLVGFRDPKDRPKPSVRPRPAPVKR